MRIRVLGAFCAVVFFSLFSTAADLELKILNYNVQGLPWPIKTHKGELPEIGRLLGEMRKQGSQPQIVFLQEAFRGDSIDELIENSGYRHVYKGPSTSDWSPLEKKPVCAGPRQPTGCPANNGKVTNSGIYILSDFKILRAQKAAFGKACTGYDCLSNKGVMMAELEVPGLSEPLIVMNTHFNSSKSSGSSQEKSDASRYAQLKVVNWFIKTYLPNLSDRAVVFGGDFNCWTTRLPYADMQRSFTMLNTQEVCLNSPATCKKLSDDPDEKFFGHTPDHVFFKSGQRTQIMPISIEKTFKIMFGDRQISDHLGLESVYRVRNI